MVGEWVQVRLDSVATLRNGAGIKQEFFSESGIPLARVSDFTQDSIDLSDCKNVEPIHAEGWKSHLLREGNVVVATVGSWPPNWTSVVGKVVRVPAGASGALQNQNTCCVLPSPNLLDQEFLFYRLKLEDFAWHAANSAGGSANQARLPVKKLGEFEFFLPPLVDQKEIASILSALDNKISLNRQINTTLESMAQVLFKSWFVDFDPVIDNALAAGNEIPDALQKRAAARAARREALRQQTNKTASETTGATDAVSSEQALPETGLSDQRLPSEIQQLFPDRFVLTEEMGWVPDGWEVQSIYSLINVVYGAPFSSKQFSSENIGTPLIRIRDLKTAKPQICTNEIHQKGTLINAGDVLVGMDAEFRPTLWAGNSGWLNQRLFFAKSNLELANSFFIKHTLQPLLALEEQSQVGTTVAHLGKKDVDKFMWLKPESRLIEAYTYNTNEVIQRWININKQTQVLADLRDSLLPKLLSGQITIPDAEQQLAEVL